MLLASAGTLYWINRWVHFGIIFSYLVVYTLLLVRTNPRLLNKRGRFLKEGTKPFDKVYAVFYVPLTYLILTISELDAVRYEWSSMPLWITLLGAAVTIPDYYVSLDGSKFMLRMHSMRAKDQQVYKSGPYRILRHPGYAAGIVSVLTAPLILGSWWGLVPGAIVAAMLVIHTELEDRTLQRELSGYKEYTKSTHHRLLPLIW